MPYSVLIVDCFVGTAIGGTFWTCEQAARTCSAVAMVVSGANWTVIHCWLKAASILAQPVSATAIAVVAGSAIRAAERRSRSRTPTLYGLVAVRWLTGQSSP